MIAFARHLQEARRLELLQLLDAAGVVGASLELLYSALPDQGVAASWDVLRAEIAWLAEQHLVGVEGEVARITTRGVDVAKGLASVPGVARPRPA